ncbi:hypothetical protein EXN66_Car020520 [Channa argus]|uniref:Uncharacterized protein n=1 Tax=Channa argus TaxID=215402 RepID=A0A6G1QQ32_CHAAH|nr:hypothetical protein EXN66_Car020520 [Channa argus]
MLMFLKQAFSCFVCVCVCVCVCVYTLYAIHMSTTMWFPSDVCFLRGSGHELYTVN